MGAGQHACSWRNGQLVVVSNECDDLLERLKQGEPWCSSDLRQVPESWQLPKKGPKNFIHHSCTTCKSKSPPLPPLKRSGGWISAQHILQWSQCGQGNPPGKTSLSSAGPLLQLNQVATTSLSQAIQALGSGVLEIQLAQMDQHMPCLNPVLLWQEHQDLAWVASERLMRINQPTPTKWVTSYDTLARHKHVTVQNQLPSTWLMEKGPCQSAASGVIQPDLRQPRPACFSTSMAWHLLCFPNCFFHAEADGQSRWAS